MNSSDFKEYVLEQLYLWSPTVSARAMFGGYGIYDEGCIFGLIADDVLYLKVDKEIQSEFEKIDSTPFIYTHKDGKKVTMSYWSVSEDMLEDIETLKVYADLSFSVAVNNKKK